MKHFVRSVFHLIAGMVITAASLGGLFVLIVLLVIFYLFYRLIWLLTPKGAILRTERKFIRTKEKLLRREFRQRKQYSRTIDEQNTHTLVRLVQKEIQLRKIHLDHNVFNETRLLLNRCETNLDFDKTLQIHDIVSNTEDTLLNSALGILFDDK